MPTASHCATLIDDFFIGTDQSAYASNFTPKSATKTEQGLIPGAVLGGRRDFIAEYLGGDSAEAGDYMMDIYSEIDVSFSAADLFFWNYGEGTDSARARLIWGGGGDLNRNLSSNNSFLIAVHSAEIFKAGNYGGSVDIRLTVVSSAGSNTVVRSISHGFEPSDLTWFFSEFSGVDFTDVDRIELWMEETLAPDSVYQVIFDDFYAVTAKEPDPPAGISSVMVSGSDLVLNGTNGLASAKYVTLCTTNLALPVTQWSRVATNLPSTGGTFTVTLPGAAAPDASPRFYQFKVE